MQVPNTRPSLILRLQGEVNNPAWREFVLAYEPFLLRLVERQGVPARHVPDVTQQLLLGIAGSVEGWRDDGKPNSFRRWLSRVARNVVVKFMNRERRQPAGIGDTHWTKLLENTPDSTDDVRAREYDYELVAWAADQVRRDFRESSWKAFWATVVDCRDVAAVARELGISPGSIYMSRSRIMARIGEKVREVTDAASS